MIKSTSNVLIYRLTKPSGQQIPGYPCWSYTVTILEDSVLSNANIRAKFQRREGRGFTPTHPPTMKEFRYVRCEYMHNGSRTGQLTLLAFRRTRSQFFLITQIFIMRMQMCGTWCVHVWVYFSRIGGNVVSNMRHTFEWVLFLCFAADNKMNVILYAVCYCETSFRTECTVDLMTHQLCSILSTIMDYKRSILD